MVRYMLTFSYIGTQFRGAQRQGKVGEFDLKTVQGVMEKALESIFVKWEVPRTYLSSRTDAGTHAFVNTAHVDLKPTGVPPPPLFIFNLNKQIRAMKIDGLSFNKVQKVPDAFHARYLARRRVYLYRIAVLNPEVVDRWPLTRQLDHYLPMPELGRLHVVRPEFNIVAFQRVLQLLCGKHDFATFMGSPSNCAPDINTVKILDAWTQPGRPVMSVDVNPMYHNLTQFHDVYFSSRSFLYRQVRRMMGAAIRVAEGNMTFDQIVHMLNNPGTDSWDPRTRLAPACGLYLANIFYNSADLEMPRMENDEDTTTDG